MQRLLAALNCQRLGCCTLCATKRLPHIRGAYRRPLVRQPAPLSTTTPRLVLVVVIKFMRVAPTTVGFLFHISKQSVSSYFKRNLFYTWANHVQVFVRWYIGKIAIHPFGWRYLCKLQSQRRRRRRRRRWHYYCYTFVHFSRRANSTWAPSCLTWRPAGWRTDWLTDCFGGQQWVLGFFGFFAAAAIYSSLGYSTSKSVGSDASHFR